MISKVLCLVYDLIPLHLVNVKSFHFLWLYSSAYGHIVASCGLMCVLYLLQERVYHNCCGNFRGWFLERICTKLHVVDHSPLFRWSRVGRRSRSCLLVSRIHPCAKPRDLDGCFLSFLDGWNHIRGFPRLGTLYAFLCSTFIIIYHSSISHDHDNDLLQLIMPSLGWRWLLAFSSVPTSLLLLFYRWTPESPRYLILQGRKAEALAILEKVAKMNGTQLPKGVLISEMETELAENKSLPTENTHLLKPGETGEAAPVSKIVVKSDKGSGFPLLALLSPELIKRTLLLWVVFFGNAFAYYGIVLLTTELKNSRNSCYPTETRLRHSSNDVNYRDVFIASFAGTSISFCYHHKKSKSVLTTQKKKKRSNPFVS